jgi:hypothetical protein
MIRNVTNAYGWVSEETRPTVMSALLPIADIRRRIGNVCQVPIADIRLSLDHLFGAREQWRRHVEQLN